MSTLALFSTSGTKLTPVSVPDKIFKAKINEPLMAQAVRVYLSNQRAATAWAKDRGDVNVTHAKVWKQKGTGRARHGAKNAPIFVGGAKAHGPSGTQNFNRKLTKSQKRASVYSALSLKFKEGAILAVSGLEKLDPKTKAFDQMVSKLRLDKNKLLLLVDKNQVNVTRGTNNLSYLTLDLAKNINTYSVLNSKLLIFTKEGLKCLE
jgi:large subunit ribosomal protein L4